MRSHNKSMRFGHHSKKIVEVNNIALTDIVMNLFLFFFITFNLLSTFQAGRSSSLKLNLPSIAKGKIVKKVSVHEIRLAKTGDLFWDETKITSEELKANLLNPENKSKSISLRADRDASVQALVTILETIRDTGATNVSLQTKISDKS